MEIFGKTLVTVFLVRGFNLTLSLSGQRKGGTKNTLLTDVRERVYKITRYVTRLCLSLSKTIFF